MASKQGRVTSTSVGTDVCTAVVSGVFILDGFKIAKSVADNGEKKKHEKEGKSALFAFQDWSGLH